MVFVDCATLPAPDFANASDFSRRFGVILRALIDVIARRFLRQPHLAPLIVPLCGRLMRSQGRLQRLLARVAAGELPRPRAPRPSRAGQPGGPPPASVWPRGKGWLVCTLGWEAAGHASQLRALLAEPEVKALLAQLPQAGRIIRPILHLLTPPEPRPPPPPKPVVRPSWWPLQLGKGSSWYGPGPRPPEADY